MPEIITNFIQKPWFIDLSLLLVFVIFFHLGIRRILKSLNKHFEKQQQLWRKTFVEAIYGPACFFVWTYTVFWSLVIIDRSLNKEPIIGQTCVTIPLVIGILALSWFFMRWKRLSIQVMTENQLWEKFHLDPQRIDVVDKIITLIILFIAAALLLEATGHGVGTLLTIGGISAAAIGFAAKDLIANFFGGLMIYINYPFRTGDLIKIPGKDTMGHVEEIGWYMTRIRDLEKLPIFIPNSLFSQTMVINLSKRTHRRIFETISIRYKDFSNMEKVIEEFQTYLDEHSFLDAKLPRFAAFSSFNTSSLDIKIMAYSTVTNRDEFIKLHQALLFKLHEIVVRNGADFAFPAMTIHMDQ